MEKDDFDDEEEGMKETGKGSHLTLEDRMVIERGITNGSSKKAMAETIGKDVSTVGKEIRLHRVKVSECTYDVCCAECATCKTRDEWAFKCSEECPDFKPFTCKRRDRSPGACNGCAMYRKCRFEKYLYSAKKAQQAYEYTLRDSREGVRLKYSKAKAWADKMGPMLKKGLSLYQICEAMPEIDVTERTLYNYFEGDLFRYLTDASVLDMRRVTSRRAHKKKAKFKRGNKDNGYLVGRTYDDFRDFLEANDGISVTEMDTVYNGDPGPYVQTFFIRRYGLLLGFLREGRTAADMTGGVTLLEDMLGHDLFRKYAPVILTDRGSEFSDADGIERGEDGKARTRVFYCDPQQASQKAGCENKHVMLRYVLPKHTDLRKAGLETQDDLDLALSHVNSAVTEKLGGKSPLELVQLSDPSLYEALERHGIRLIPSDEIILTPELLKRKK